MSCEISNLAIRIQAIPETYLRIARESVIERCCINPQPFQFVEHDKRRRLDVYRCYSCGKEVEVRR